MEAAPPITAGVRRRTEDGKAAVKPSPVYSNVKDTSG